MLHDLNSGIVFWGVQAKSTPLHTKNGVEDSDFQHT